MNTESLQKKKMELMQRLEAINKDLQKSHSADFAEQVTERENDDVLRSLSNETTAELNLVNRALTRIADGTYGQCASCGKAISPQRLQALPEAENCMACA